MPELNKQLLSVGGLPLQKGGYANPLLFPLNILHLLVFIGISACCALSGNSIEMCL